MYLSLIEPPLWEESNGGVKFDQILPVLNRVDPSVTLPQGHGQLELHYSSRIIWTQIVNHINEKLLQWCQIPSDGKVLQ